MTVFAIDEEVKVSLLPYAAACGFAPVLLPTSAGIVGRAAQIRALADSVDADVVHVFGPWLGPAASVAAATRPRQAAVVTNWTMDNVYFTPRYTPMIVGTQHLVDDLEATRSGPVWLMEPPVDLAADEPDPSRGRTFREQHGVADDEVLAVVVGRVDAHLKAEGLGHAIDACAELAHTGLRLAIVGDGDAFEEISDRAAAVNARLGRQAVILTGSLADPRPAYDGADIALGMGGSALRALAHAKPLVVLGEKGFARPFDPSTTPYFYAAGFFGDEPETDPWATWSGCSRSWSGTGSAPPWAGSDEQRSRARFGLEVMATLLERIYRQTLDTLPHPAVRLGNAAYVTARTVAHQARRTMVRHPGPGEDHPLVASEPGTGHG